MSDVSADFGSELPEAEDAFQAASPTAIALVAQATHSYIVSTWDQLLDDHVFSLTPNACIGPKEEKTYRRLLKSRDGNIVVSILWKESSFVTERDLQDAKMAKRFPENAITQHRLAVALATKPSEVAALTYRVRNICIAAAAFGLVERDEISETKVLLRGTNQLHRLMLAVGQTQFTAVRSVATMRSVPPPSGQSSSKLSIGA